MRLKPRKLALGGWVVVGLDDRPLLRDDTGEVVQFAVPELAIVAANDANFDVPWRVGRFVDG